MDAAGGRGDEIDLIEKSEAAALEMALETGKAPGWRSGRQGYLEGRNPSRVPLSYFETGARNDVSKHPVGQKISFLWRRVQSRRLVSWFAFCFEDLLQGNRCPDFVVWV